MFIIFPDQDECWKQAAKLNGVPNLRRVHASRTVPGEPDVERMVPLLMDALTRPLTGEERQKGQWAIPDKRILFEGGLEEAQDLPADRDYPDAAKCPPRSYSDGLPVIVPTEERVREMLKGTSHAPDEVIIFHEDHELHDRSIQMGNSGKKGVFIEI